MVTLLKSLSKSFPDLSFKKSRSFYWSPNDQIIYYASIKTNKDSCTLLHETSHGILNHTSYGSDFELLKLELEAWDKAKNLARQFDIKIDENHIEDCLDTYRDWLHKRSICPKCGVKSLQVADRHYNCMNCDTSWQVSCNRLCRTYRRRLR